MARYLITGANRGIGLAMAKLLHNRGEEVIAACREATPALMDLGVEVINSVDVTTETGIQLLVSKLNQRPLDVLINNAGVLYRTELGDTDRAIFRHSFEVNALAPVMVINALLPFMHQGSKIGIISSRMASIEDNERGGSYSYRMTKAAVNAAGRSFSIDLKPKGIAVAILHPGYVQTRMIDFNGDITPDEAAVGLIARMDALNLENTGTFWHQSGLELPW